MSFGAVGGNFNVPKSTFDISQGNNWVETWVQLQGFEAQSTYFLRRSYFPTTEWQLSINPGGGGALASLSFGNENFNSAPALIYDTNWHHVAFSIGNGNLVVAMDGQARRAAAAAAAPSFVSPRCRLLLSVG